MRNLPTSSPELLAHSAQLAAHIRAQIAASGGWISFAAFMQAALYTPSLGYYSGGGQKFGDYQKGGGDFVTAPQISPIFAQTLARQAAQVLAETAGDDHVCNIMELGTGTGQLAADLLLELAQLNQLPQHYFILEVSDHLRQVQRETLQRKLPPNLFERVVWLNDLAPSPLGGEGWGEGGFNGLILANEVLDALPVHILHHTAVGWVERGVAFDNEFIWQDADLSQPNLASNLPPDLPTGYVTETCPAASGLVKRLVETLRSGAILLIDYGFSAAEYYHPQRNEGTLMCHFQHYAHSEPLIYAGLQDITAHVDFTRVAEAALNEPDNTQNPYPISLAGYVSQAQFLMNCGILEMLSQHSPDTPHYMQLAAATQKLLSPAEMGELFKVIGFAKNMRAPLIGFMQGDKSHTL